MGICHSTLCEKTKKFYPQITNHTRGNLVRSQKAFRPLEVLSVRFLSAPAVGPSLPGHRRPPGRCVKCVSAAVINLLPPQSRPTTQTRHLEEIQPKDFIIEPKKLINHVSRKKKKILQFL